MVALRTTRPELRCYVVFEGGGAKGVAHVGALQAFDAAGLDLRGFAGTSAGAIVAALAAAGYGGRDIIDADGRTLLDDPALALSPPDARALFTGRDWEAIQRLSKLRSWGGPAWLAVLLAGALLLLLGLTWLALQSWWLAVVAVPLLLGCAVEAWRHVSAGAAWLDRFRDVLDRAMAARLFPDEPGRSPVFADFGAHGRPMLKIVATDLVEGRHLFSPQTTPQVRVADAVAASICLPFIFRARRIGEGLYFDGGLISNLPTWVFDVERILDPEALTIGVELAEAETRPEVTPERWLVRAIRTAIFGRPFLNQRGIDRLIGLRIPAEVDLLAFDMSREKATCLVADAFTVANARLQRELILRPNVYRTAGEEVLQALNALFDELRDKLFEHGDPGHTRVALIVPERDGVTEGASFRPRYLRVRHAVGYGDHTDERLTLPVEGSIAGAAWRGANGNGLSLTLLRTAHGNAVRNDLLPGDENRQRRKLVWRDMAWVLCVPVVDSADAEQREYIVSVDGSGVLRATRQGETIVPDAAVEETFSWLRGQIAAIYRQASEDMGDEQTVSP